MNIIRKVSEEEMVEMFPDFMNALYSPDARYCWGDCDGLRVFKDDKCTICGWECYEVIGETFNEGDPTRKKVIK